MSELVQQQIDYDNQQDYLDLAKVDSLRSLNHRLTRELTLWDQCNQALAVLRSNEILGELGATTAEADTNGAALDALPAQVTEVRRQRGRLIEAMRHACYETTNKLKQLSQQSRQKQQARRQALDNGVAVVASEEVPND